MRSLNDIKKQFERDCLRREKIMICMIIAYCLVILGMVVWLLRGWL